MNSPGWVGFLVRPLCFQLLIMRICNAAQIQLSISNRLAVLSSYPMEVQRFTVDTENKIVEVTYAGTHEKADYRRLC